MLFVIECLRDACYAGKICPPAISGVGVGGTADLCMALAKKAALRRRVGSCNANPALAALEDELMQAARGLGLGPMGAGTAVVSNISGTLAPEAYTLRFLRYGMDGVSGGCEPVPTPLPREVGLVIEAVAPTQELADTVIGLARSSALHQAFPNRKATAGNSAFPFSPSDFQGDTDVYGSQQHFPLGGLEVDRP